ncbi:MULTISPECIES: hypothetical protein [Sphingobacterium]|uniref:Uncharacterized protein n=1 Tax=Sphingobacterium populi TaxID=1812824 RepID=A0ABW5UEB6_9SPHI|nr:hypothetical protein [Sphingobacterium sp. CFCC 11742]
MATILLTFGTRPIAQRIAKILSPHHQVIMATHEPIPSVLSSTYKAIPNPANPVFAHEMLKLCLDNGIDLILPLGAHEINVLSGAAVLLEEYGIYMVCPSIDAQSEIAKQIPSTTPLQIVYNNQSLGEQTEASATLGNGVYVSVDNNWLPVIL